MGLLHLIVILAVLGCVVYLIQTLPIDGRFKTVINVIVVLALCFFLLDALGIGDISLGHLR